MRGSPFILLALSLSQASEPKISTGKSKIAGSEPADALRLEIERSGANLTSEEKKEVLEQIDSEWDLIKEVITSTSILQNHMKFFKDTTIRRSRVAKVLGFVTPWSEYGYAMAEKFAKKFDILSPTWFELKLRRRDVNGKKRLALELRGDHLVSPEWKTAVESKGCSVIPRLLIDPEGSINKTWGQILRSRKAQEKVTEKLVQVSEPFEGLLLELYGAWELPRKSETVAFIKRVAASFKTRNKKVLLALPPYRKGSKGFTYEHFLKIIDDVDGIVLLTIGYSDSNLGAESPVNWVEQTLHEAVGMKSLESREIAEKVMVVVSFQGTHYRGQQGAELSGRRFISLLENHTCAIHWNPKAMEHVAVYKEKESGDSGGILNMLMYPTLASIQARLRVCRAAGVSVGVWGVGQGLHYFFDLL
ncbi:hypothetical protein AAMO2058_001580500 [Amorphochlora amoebiformis]